MNVQYRHKCVYTRTLTHINSYMRACTPTYIHTHIHTCRLDTRQKSQPSTWWVYVKSNMSIYTYVWVCVCVCMFVCMYACTYVCNMTMVFRPWWVYANSSIHTYIIMCVCVCMYVRMYVCLYVYVHENGECNSASWHENVHCCMYKQPRACIYVFMYVCMYVCMIVQELLSTHASRTKLFICTCIH